jgi:cell division protein FtsI/penicillin-binding protein 2
MRFRFLALTVIFAVFIAAVIVRLFALQVLSHDFYKALADNQHLAYTTLVPQRGEIYIQEDKNGKIVPVVTNIDKNLVYAVPPEITNKDQAAAVLAPILEMPKKEILEKIVDDQRKWVALKKELPESVSEGIQNLKLPGIYLEPETYRYYPEGEFASQVLGFFGYEGDVRVGRYGIEEYYDKILAGKSGFLTLDKNLQGTWIASAFRRLTPVENGADIILTLDRAIQFKAESLLEEAVTSHQADSGSLIVLSAKTGAVLAAVNYPSFDPNSFNKVADPAVFRNLLISDAYEPGSVFKPVTMAAGLEAGAITPETTYEDKGFAVINDFTIKNADDKVYGTQTMTSVLEQSINTGAIFVQNLIGPEKFLETVKKFGFGKPTGINLPAEASGSIKNLIGGGDVHYATASFGQGITVTALQLAQAFQAIANQGKMMKPYLVQKIQYADGKEEEFGPQEVGQVISAKSSNTLAAMLVEVVENGHGKRAGVAGYYLAGKTGTAQVAKADGPGYDPDKTIGTFAGFGPVNDPAFVMVVKIVNPKTVRFAESTAAPVFGEMAKFLLNYFQIPPTR